MINKLVAIQHELKAPKGQYNSFGKYKYRSAEDILDAVKPLLHEHGLVLLISDRVRQMGDRFYIEAIATLRDGTDFVVETTAFAREALTKKGMDESQITGSASSYARKYALNGLFAIDDTKDADTQDNRQPKQEKKPPTGKPKTNGVTDAQKDLIGSFKEVLHLTDKQINSFAKREVGKPYADLTEADCNKLLKFFADVEMKHKKEQAKATAQ